MQLTLQNLFLKRPFSVKVYYRIDLVEVLFYDFIHRIFLLGKYNHLF